MTDQTDTLRDYKQFNTPITMQGIWENILYAYGKGAILLQSLTDPNSTSTRLLADVMWVSNLPFSIISANPAKINNDSTTMDDNEDVLKSNNPNLTAFSL